jgi:putative SOS response-associated peptidase YedK
VPLTSFGVRHDRRQEDSGLVASDGAWPLLCFAGLWTNWTSVRKAKEGEVTADIFAFLTTEPNVEIACVSQGNARYLHDDRRT